MRRHLIGIIAIMLLVGAVIFWIWPPTAQGWQIQLEAACWRLGALMAVLWVAYPQVYHMPAWLLAMLPLLVVVLAIRPRWFLLALPIIIALAILKPQIGRRG